MKQIGIILIILGVIGIFVGFIIYGGVGLVCVIGSLSSLFSGIGFLILNKEINDLYEDDD